MGRSRSEHNVEPIRVLRTQYVIGQQNVSNKPLVYLRNSSKYFANKDQNFKFLIKSTLNYITPTVNM